jgi:hypothetical protein
MATRRIIVTLSDKDRLWLEGYSKVHKISLAEAIRRGIKELKKGQRGKTYKGLVERTSGIWPGEDGLEYQRKIRTEWD